MKELTKDQIKSAFELYHIHGEDSLNFLPKEIYNIPKEDILDYIKDFEDNLTEPYHIKVINGKNETVIIKTIFPKVKQTKPRKPTNLTLLTEHGAVAIEIGNKVSIKGSYKQFEILSVTPDLEFVIVMNYEDGSSLVSLTDILPVIKPLEVKLTDEDAINLCRSCNVEFKTSAGFWYSGNYYVIAGKQIIIHGRTIDKFVSYRTDADWKKELPMTKIV